MDRDPHDAERPTQGQTSDGLAPFAWLPVVAVAAAVFVLLMLVAGRYGYHRDELYFVAASKHLSWGYVDQPPLSVALVWLARRLFGDSLHGLRLFPALAFAAGAVLAGLTARELGGRRFSQILSALILAVSPFLIMAHLAGPTVYDLVGWALVMLLVVRILRTGDQRLWLPVGLVIGVSLYAKHTILLLVMALIVGFVVCRRWKVLRSPYLWAGAAVAILLWLPNLVWQAQHDWPTLAMSGALQANHSGAGYSITFLVLQFLLPGVWAAPVWLAGLWAFLREQRWVVYRPFAVAYLLLFVLIVVAIADRPYYLAPLYVVLIGAGSVITAGVVEGRRRFFSEQAPKRRFLWRSPAAAFVWVAVPAALFLPLSLPILPANWLATVPLQSVNYNLGEEIGWPELTKTVAKVYQGLPPDEQAKTTIVTANYGEAGAIDRYGPALGLPPAHSGHNNYYWWGAPPPDASTVIVVGFWGGQHLAPYFAEYEQAATIGNAAGVDNDEDGLPVWVGRGLTLPWAEMWSEFRHYD